MTGGTGRFWEKVGVLVGFALAGFFLTVPFWR